MPLPKFTLQLAFSWSVYFSNRTESYLIFGRSRPWSACCRIRTCRDFQKKGKRKPTCHFPSSVYSLPSLGVFTFRIVLNRILHKSSLLARMESRRTRRPAFTAEERLERRREQDRRRHAERRARERREQTQARRDVDRLRSVVYQSSSPSRLDISCIHSGVIPK